MSVLPVEREGSVFAHYDDFSVEYRDASHRYWICRHDGSRFPAVSVTSALKVLSKDALLDWAEDCGARGAAQLAAMGELDGVPLTDVVGLVRLHNLGKDAKRDAGADRGTAVHNVLERWALHREVPSLADFTPAVRGFVQGLSRALLTLQPEPTSVEKIIASPTHGYAGRMDLRAKVDGADTVIDLKTNPKGRVYDEAHLQAAAYALADQECGAPEPDAIMIVAVGEEGNFEAVDCDATARDFLAVLACQRAVKRLSAATRARWRATRKAREAEAA